VPLRTRYGLRALVRIAAAPAGEALPLSQIAAEEGIPAAFLERILRRLRGAGLVSARRGARGGYRLARPAGEISVADVVTALEGRRSLVSCLPDAGACRRSARCRTRVAWQRLDEAVARALDGVTVADLVAGPAAAAAGPATGAGDGG